MRTDLSLAPLTVGFQWEGHSVFDKTRIDEIVGISRHEILWSVAIPMQLSYQERAPIPFGKQFPNAPVHVIRSIHPTAEKIRSIKLYAYLQDANEPSRVRIHCQFPEDIQPGRDYSLIVTSASNDECMLSAKLVKKTI